MNSKEKKFVEKSLITLFILLIVTIIIYNKVDGIKIVKEKIVKKKERIIIDKDYFEKVYLKEINSFKKLARDETIKYIKDVYRHINQFRKKSKKYADDITDIESKIKIVYKSINDFIPYMNDINSTFDKFVTYYKSKEKDSDYKKLKNIFKNSKDIFFKSDETKKYINNIYYRYFFSKNELKKYISSNMEFMNFLLLKRFKTLISKIVGDLLKNRKANILGVEKEIFSKFNIMIFIEKNSSNYLDLNFEKNIRDKANFIAFTDSEIEILLTNAFKRVLKDRLKKNRGVDDFIKGKLGKQLTQNIGKKVTSTYLTGFVTEIVGATSDIFAFGTSFVISYIVHKTLTSDINKEIEHEMSNIIEQIAINVRIEMNKYFNDKIDNINFKFKDL